VDELVAALARVGLRGASGTEEEPSLDDVRRLVASGDLLQGALRVNAKNPTEAFVSVEGYTRDVAVVGLQRRNRAFEGDVVALSLLPRDGAKTAGNRRGPEGSNGDEQFQAVVVCVVEHKHRILHIGHLRAPSDPAGTTAGHQLEFVPHDARFPCFQVPAVECPADLLLQLGEADGAAADMLLSAKIESWPKDSEVPRARLVDVLGQAGDIAAETNALLIENGIDAAPFPPDVLADLPRAADFQRILAEQVPLRRDFRRWVVE